LSLGSPEEVRVLAMRRIVAVLWVVWYALVAVDGLAGIPGLVAASAPAPAGRAACASGACGCSHGEAAPADCCCCSPAGMAADSFAPTGGKSRVSLVAASRCAGREPGAPGSSPKIADHVPADALAIGSAIPLSAAPAVVSPRTDDPPASPLEKVPLLPPLV
jgi:hypothetical protein